jgi:hypothetical protein
MLRCRRLTCLHRLHNSWLPAVKAAAAAAAAAPPGSCGVGCPEPQQRGHDSHISQQRRSLWNEHLDARESRRVDSFYDSTIERYAQMPIETLSLEQVRARASDVQRPRGGVVH